MVPFRQALILECENFQACAKSEMFDTADRRERLFY
jgi:hypothetical protein